MAISVLPSEEEGAVLGARGPRAAGRRSVWWVLGERAAGFREVQLGDLELPAGWATSVAWMDSRTHADRFRRHARGSIGELGVDRFR